MRHLLRFGFIVGFVLFVYNHAALAQTNTSTGNLVTAEQLKLAQDLQKLRPVKVHLDAAIDKFVHNAPLSQQDILKEKLTRALNYKTMETVSINAYAETYTEEELKAMIAYYGSEAGKSASKKSSAYTAKVYPHIIKMLDKAAMDTKLNN